MKLFSNKEAAVETLLLKGFDAYYNGDQTTEGYLPIVNKLKTQFPNDTLCDIMLNEEKKDFIETFSKWLKLYHFLISFDEFDDEKMILKKAEIQDYKSYYLDFKDQTKETKKLEDISNDLTFEIELIKSQEYTLDYIFELIFSQIKGKSKTDFVKNFLHEIERAIGSSTILRPKKEVILEFINSQNFDPTSFSNCFDLECEFKKYVEQNRDAKLKEIAEKYNMDIDKLNVFFNLSIDKGEFSRRGNEFSSLFKFKIPLLAIKGFNDNDYDKKRETEDKAFDDLIDLFNETNLSN
ncbi:hypothetical protein [Mycoplasma sp. NEAQ87857]|uniref:type I restriction endonuclease subunit R, EcoR124 family n=1 Tax=Mycoplasma sp. NEAQ87857 TaxID=2683967 RepID=UPI002103AC86|nr:hypothetical protein [Mycoplasma sp. NEAQ87857]